ncbi:hypothetical protein BJY04DRAFT_178138 [Aspergillus karnatakaensis]|uniref:uncharacterized protein n=1 Tax=Aspergillus karnatakaensis TaxID=1810916 RepID=UPI003CCD1563
MKGSAEPCLKHECSITNHAHIRADLAMTVTTHADSTRCLIIQTEYHLRWKVKPPTSIRDRGFRNESLSGFNEPNFKPIFICPHRSIFEIYGTVRLEMDCDICKTFAYVTNSYSDHAHPSDRIIIRVVRNLGGLDRERWSPWYFNSRCEVDSHYRRWYLGDRFGAWSKREYDDEEGPLYLNNHRRRTKTGSGLKKAIELKRAFKHPFSSGN